MVLYRTFGGVGSSGKRTYRLLRNLRAALPLTRSVPWRCCSGDLPPEREAGEEV